jgi:RHS repeat-associated protein
MTRLSAVRSKQNFSFTQKIILANIPLNLGFPGQYYDAETLTWNNGYRDYNSGFGRYLESDPIGLNGGVNTYAYVGNNPLSYVDPYGQSTFQIGFAFNGQFGLFNLNFGAGLAFDSHGGVGTYDYGGGGGGGAGAGVGGGVQFAVSDANRIKDLSGPFGNTSASAGDVVGASVDYFSGPGSCGQLVTGSGFTLGLGAGASLEVGVSTTSVHTF